MIAYDDGTLTCCEVAVFWVECDRHDEEGCYMAVCEVCDAVDRDCEGVAECFDNHLWVGEPTYCDKCGVDKGQETQQ